MKSNNLLLRTSKLYASFIIVMLVCVTAFTSCKKDSGSSATSAVSQDEAAEAITEAVTPESGGMVSQVNESVSITADNISPCGESFDSSINISSPSGNTITYAFNLDWNWVFTCSPASFQFNFSGSSMYDAPRMSSDDSSSGTMDITGLETNKTNYVINVDYTRNGTQQSKILNKNSFTSKIIISSEDINVSKSSQEIVSGTATVSISGASSGGVSFSYHGTIVFNGNKTATLTLGNGAEYTITWQ